MKGYFVCFHGYAWKLKKKKQFTSVLVCILIFCFVFSDICDCLAILLTAALTYIPTSLSVLVTSVISPRDYKDWSIIPEEYIDLINLNNQARGRGGRVHRGNLDYHLLLYLRLFPLVI